MEFLLERIDNGDEVPKNGEIRGHKPLGEFRWWGWNREPLTKWSGHYILYSWSFLSLSMPCHSAWGPEKQNLRIQSDGLVHNLRMVITNRTNFITYYYRFEDTERCLVIVV